jgi:hypothetical protein
MTKYGSHIVNENGHVADRREVSRATDEETRLGVTHEVKLDSQADVWAAERCVGRVTCEAAPSTGMPS